MKTGRVTSTLGDQAGKTIRRDDVDERLKRLEDRLENECTHRRLQDAQMVDLERRIVGLEDEVRRLEKR